MYKIVEHTTNSAAVLRRSTIDQQKRWLYLVGIKSPFWAWCEGPLLKLRRIGSQKCRVFFYKGRFWAKFFLVNTIGKQGLMIIWFFRSDSPFRSSNVLKNILWQSIAWSWWQSKKCCEQLFLRTTFGLWRRTQGIVEQQGVSYKN